jgi:bacterioferritin-associated ferredoxin
MYVCVCAAVKKAEIEKELHNGATLEDLQNKLGVANNCCVCLESLVDMLTNKYTDGTRSTSQ